MARKDVQTPKRHVKAQSKGKKKENHIGTDQELLALLHAILTELEDLNSGISMLIEGQGSESVVGEIQGLKGTVDCILSVLEKRPDRSS